MAMATERIIAAMPIATPVVAIRIDGVETFRFLLSFEKCILLAMNNSKFNLCDCFYLN